MIKYNDLTVMIGGQAGDGSLATGEVLAKAYKKMGLHVATNKDFPSRIRGGHTSYTIRGAKKRVFAVGDYIDVLLAFDYDSIEQDLASVAEGGVLIFDTSNGDMEIPRTDIQIYKMPLAKIARQELGLGLIKNTLALGVIKELFDLNGMVFKETLKIMYKAKGPKIIQQNIQAFEYGAKYALENFKKVKNYKIEVGTDSKDVLLMMGNEAIGLAAVIAGCRFISGYPITPASDILEFMARYLPEHGGVAIQAEVEIAGITMAIGAGYAGARSMTVTSGPGLDLKTEAMGLAGMIEVPVVIVDAQRGGPSTGMPTKTEQSDINHVVYGGHGEIPRIVLVPGTVEEAFYFTAEAFNLAEKYQCPVIILTDELISWNKQTVSRFDLSKIHIDRGKLVLHTDGNDREFKRFLFTEDGISPRPIPSVPGGIHLATSDEHDEYGHITTNRENRIKIMQKRMTKIETAKKDVFVPEIYGKKSEHVIISLGSTIGPILEAIEYFEQNGIDMQYVRIRTLVPFLDDELKRILTNVKQVFVVENNYTGQLATIIKAHISNLNIVNILKYDGKPFKPKEIYTQIMEAMKNE